MSYQFQIRGIVWPPRPEGSSELPETATIALSSSLVESGPEDCDHAYMKAEETVGEIEDVAETNPRKALRQLKKVPFLAERIKEVAEEFDLTDMDESEWQDFFEQVLEDWHSDYSEKVGVSEEAYDQWDAEWVEEIIRVLEVEFGERAVAIGGFGPAPDA